MIYCPHSPTRCWFIQSDTPSQRDYATVRLPLGCIRRIHHTSTAESYFIIPVIRSCPPKSLLFLRLTGWLTESNGMCGFPVALLAVCSFWGPNASASVKLGANKGLRFIEILIMKLIINICHRIEAAIPIPFPFALLAKEEVLFILCGRRKIVEPTAAAAVAGNEEKRDRGGWW